MTTQNLPIVIIGTGLAGYSLAKEIRKLDKEQPLVFITQDDGHFYSKPLLSTAFAQKNTPQTLVITDVDTMRSQLNATIHTFSTVTDIDIEEQKITFQNTDNAQSFHFSQLVFAMGAIPRPFPFFNELRHHYRINSLMDYASFVKNLELWQHLTIIGSGLVGCEFAHDLAQTHLDIEVVTPDPYPLCSLVPKLVGDALQQSLAAQGIQWHTSANISHSEVINDHYLLHLGQQTIKTHGVLTAIGIQPNIELAKRSHVIVNKGIVVDDYLQTNFPQVFALGDCAEISGQCRQFVAPILQCARALAQTLTGKLTPVRLPLMPISLKVSSYPIIAFPPPLLCEGEWQYEKLNHDIKGIFCDVEGQVKGYVLSGKYLEERQACLQALTASLAPISS
jgi:rubredoxin-NAD+ reductase